MKDSSSYPTAVPEQALNSHYLQLLNKFKKYNSHGHKLLCSYMSAGEKYQNGLLVIGREPFYWHEEFSPEEIYRRGAQYVFDSKVLQHGANELISPSHNFSCNSFNDPFLKCIKEVVMQLGICRQHENWSSYIALTYLFKLAFSRKGYLPEKPRNIQIELCREILHLELSILKPKRVLFLTGMKYMKEFLNLSDDVELTGYVHNLGEFDYGIHKAQTVITVNPVNCPRQKLVSMILERFANNKH